MTPSESTGDAGNASTEIQPRRRSRRRQAAFLFGCVAGLWLALAYLLLPLAWNLFYRRHPSLDDLPDITQTSAGIPGDPINVALIGLREDVEKLMADAGWSPADALGLTSDIKIAADTVLDRPYKDAPVSSLFLFGRKEDLAFEKPVGNSPQHRHHVRYWKSPTPDHDGRPIWVGSVTYDKSVGLSHTTGQITHHIDGDLDAERGRLFDDLKQTRELSETYIENGFHETLTGKNGGGDPWKTDGDLWVAVIAPGPVANA
ncbi:MAG TPA: LssY C-terminal domain-containing protein, partial [Caulifigura sp.]|nr:LssY C-terminal domain-containing protein [Caulifigura sp.]